MISRITSAGRLSGVAALLLITLEYASAQKTDFRDDVFPQLWNLSLDGQKSRLNEYLLEEPAHPFSLFRTAMIYEVNYRSANPLTDYEYAIANARKAESNYLRAQTVVKADEVRSHDEYYARIYNLYDPKGKPQVPFTIIESRMRNGLDSARIFLNAIPPLYKDFTRGISAYERSVKAFTEINSRFATAEDMQMLYDEKLETELLAIKRNYDSAVIYLNSYLKRSEATQPLGFRQRLTTRPVGTFRLDGFVNILNFLIANVRLWDYGAWVDDVIKIHNTEVADLRSKTTAALASLDASMESIDKSTPQTLPKPYKVDKQIYFNLSKYDKPSFMAGLLTYKSYLQDWKLNEKGRVLDTAASENNAAILTGLVYQSRHADTLLTELKALVTPHNLAKHKAYVSGSLGGENGVKEYLTAQNTQIQSRFRNYAGAIRTNLAVEKPQEVYQNATRSVRNGNQVISFDTTLPAEELMKNGAWLARANFRNADGSAYLLGEYFTDKTHTAKAAFAAGIGADGHVSWVKTFPIHLDSGVVNDANAAPGPAVVLQDGIAFFLHARHTSRDESKVWLVNLGSHGEERFRTPLPDSRMPRKLMYSERANGFVLVQRGASATDDLLTDAPVRITHMNALGEVDWHREWPWKGTFTGIFDFSDGYGLVGNYTEIRDQAGKLYKTGSPAEFNPFLMRMNTAGEIILIHPLKAEKPLMVTRVVRLGDNGIHFMGTGTPPVHVMTNRNGEIICSSW